MKKTLALILSLAMMLTCIVGFAFNSSAATLEWVEETYTYLDAIDDIGIHADELEIDESTGSYDSSDGFFLRDGLWTFEYWDPEIEGFEPMTSYYKEKQDGWVFGSWSNSYTCFAEAAWTNSGYSYCGILNNGKSLHPGSTAGAVLTYIVPVTGTVSYDVGVFANSNGNTAEKQPDSWGSVVTVYLNDDQIWPAADDTSETNRISYDTNPSATPLEVSVSSFKVNEGDKIRLCVTAYAGNKSSKRVDISSHPVVTYHEAVVPIGNPNGNPPVNILTERAGKDTTDMNVTWEAAKNAAGYNLYLDEEKINDTPVTECSYTITGLESSKLYELTITTVTNSGVESAPSDPQTFKTIKIEDAKVPATDTSSAGTSAPATTDQGNAPVDTGKKDGGFPIWIIIVAAVAVIAIVIVLVLVFGKKKKPAEAAEETAPAEDEKKDAE